MTDAESKRAEGISGTYPFNASDAIELIRAYAILLDKYNRLKNFLERMKDE